MKRTQVFGLGYSLCFISFTHAADSIRSLSGHTEFHCITRTIVHSHTLTVAFVHTTATDFTKRTFYLDNKTKTTTLTVTATYTYTFPFRYTKHSTHSHHWASQSFSERNSSSGIRFTHFICILSSVFSLLLLLFPSFSLRFVSVILFLHFFCSCVVHTSFIRRSVVRWTKSSRNIFVLCPLREDGDVVLTASTSSKISFDFIFGMQIQLNFCFYF